MEWGSLGKLKERWVLVLLLLNYSIRYTYISSLCYMFFKYPSGVLWFLVNREVPLNTEAILKQNWPNSFGSPLIQMFILVKKIGDVAPLALRLSTQLYCFDVHFVPFFQQPTWHPYLPQNGDYIQVRSYSHVILSLLLLNIFFVVRQKKENLFHWALV